MQAPQLEHSIPPRQDRTARRGSPQLTDAVADDNGWSDSEKFLLFQAYTSFTGEALPPKCQGRFHPSACRLTHCSALPRRVVRFAQPVPALPLHGFVALTRCVLQILSAFNLDVPSL